MVDQSPDAIRVLIADDHRMFADSLGRLLAGEDDIDVVAVTSNSHEAVQLAATLKPTVVLVDYQMPELDGVGITSQIKHLAPDTMVVMLTGSTEDRVLLAAIEVGCSGFLTKDRAANEVVDAVRAAAAGEALISPAMLARLLPRLNRTTRQLGADLTERELEILGHLAGGAANKVIAAEVHLSVNTVRNYVQSILSKLGAHSKLEAVSKAVQEGIIDYPSRP